MKRTILVLILLAVLSVSASAVFGPDDVNVPACAEPIRYGTSGAGRPLMAYRFGKGKNVMVLTFCIHGFEDNWAHDGEALVWTADVLMRTLSEHMEFLADYDWSVYVLPCLNPDGLLDGHTNDGPGRCSTAWIDSWDKQYTNHGTDLNRTFPASWRRYTDARNFNGDAPLAAAEARALADFVNSVKGDGRNLCVDAHGWYSQVITTTQDSTIYKVFSAAFPGNRYGLLTGSHGYFSWYMQQQGFTTCLFEFPDGCYSLEKFQSKNYASRFFGCILTLAEKYGTWTDRHVTVTVRTPGGGTFSGGGACTRGDTVRLLAQPSGDAKFLGWYGDGGRLLSRSAQFSLTASESCTVYAVFDSDPYIDVGPDDWYREDALTARSMNLVLGTTDITFDAAQPFTRAMAAQMLMRLSGGTAPASSPYQDVASSAWYASAMTWAKENGILQNIAEDTKADPDRPITRAEFLTMTVRTLALRACSCDPVPLPFLDAERTPAYAADAIGQAYAMGLTQGDSAGNLRPLDALKRAEGAAVLLRAYRYMNQRSAALE